MSSSNAAPSASCLRCPGPSVLVPLAQSTAEIVFYECPSCLRHYARKGGGALTFRWRHPISLALYGVLFESQPLGAAPNAAAALASDRSSDEVDAFAREIELELACPTQQVRDILENVASEEACREFLAEVVRILRLGATKI